MREISQRFAAALRTMGAPSGSAVAALAIVLGLGPVAAEAADKPVIAPPAAWVKPAGPTPAAPASDGAAIRVLLDDGQVNVTAAGVESYGESVYRIETPEGLSVGTVSFAWKPDTDTVTVHKIHIIRDGKVIDVLAGQEFTVLRRETNLERAALDGTLTATLQPEGLQVGDIVDLAMTVTRVDPLFAGKPETLVTTPIAFPIDDSRRRLRWPVDLPVRWRTTDPVPALTETRASGFVELNAAVKNLQPAVQPKFAPMRFAVRRQTELTAFRSWAEIGALLAPLYTKAAVIPTGSPLAAELDKIRALSPDPKLRAEAALRLVQDRVRYLFLGLGDGGMVPADAATTWARRFGDCKGKTALLLALLDALGVAADPVAVNAGDGDGIDQRLPMVSLFNHVLVRATIAGRTYWLDGTRIGDRKLEDIPAPAFRWGLPLVAKDAALVAIPLTSATKPYAERVVTIDASAGVAAPAPLSASQVWRGDGALSARANIANMTPADRDRALGEYWRKEYPDLTVKTVAARYDEGTNEYVVTVEGTTQMDWSSGSYEADDMGLGWKADFTRDEGPRKDAPYGVGFPAWGVSRETIVLPNRGKGFTAGPAEVAQTVGGVEYQRHAEIKDGKYVVEASARAIAPEFPASEVAVVQKKLREMNDRRVFLNLSSNYEQTDADVNAYTAKNPDTPAAYALGGARHARKGEYEAAAAVFTKAIALDPKNAEIIAARGLAYGVLGRKADAAADFDAAIAINPREANAWRGRGALAIDDERWADAVKALTNALETRPGDPELLQMRSVAAFRAGDGTLALSDASGVITRDPKNVEGYLAKANALALLKRRSDAALVGDDLLRAVPGDANAERIAGNIFAHTGRSADALRAFDRAIALEGGKSATTYLDRARARPADDVTGRAGDLDAALRLDAKLLPALYLRAALAEGEGDLPLAGSIYGRLVEAAPDDLEVLARRGLNHLKRKETALGEKDLAAARDRAKSPDQLNTMCWARATAGLTLDAALAECDAALAIDPKSNQIHDSRGFVLLRLGRFADAIAAYDKALDGREIAESFYGRGIARLRAGQKDAGEADLKAALVLDAGVAAEFRGYGVVP